jgi:hypothetical protein
MTGESRVERIRQRAHELWEASGRTGGPEVSYWGEAVRSVDDELFGVTEPGQRRSPDPPESHRV